MTTRPELAAPPILDMDPYAEDVLLQPDAFFEQLRERAPVVRLTRYGVYAVGRQAECKEVLTDYSRFTTTGGVGLADARKPGDARPLSDLLEVDPPDHTSTRSTVQRLLSPLVIKGWRSEFDTAADKLVLSVKGRDIEAMEDLAEAFVYEVFPKALGIRFEPEAIRAIGLMMFNQSGPKNALYHAAMAGGAPYLDWLQDTCRRENVVPGSVSEQLFIAEDEDRLRPGIAANIVRAFVRGGTDSTIAGLGALIRSLSLQPESWRKLKAEPSKLRLALDEAIRLESPFHVTYRTTLGPTELAGYALEADTKIAVFPGSANRDPRVWSEPHVFDLDRRVAGKHLAFGTADHNCIGQMLARLESECLVGSMLRHCETLQPTSTATYRTINQMRMIDTLPIRLG
ncbi:cytochrome P450 [uncultured Brevundimonas sp.]|uniref:cytochrome P450 n=1 Tax=uncultured Brevundimonas sp. TaxID=213418 RepID=UPI0025CCBBF5|nr:cytochrome P450 [uncultured Brevundimonas sp.]